MDCPQDCIFLINSLCNVTELTSSNQDDCKKAANCINYFTYVALSLLGTLTLQVIVLTTCLLCCCKRKWTRKKIHKYPSAGQPRVVIRWVLYKIMNASLVSPVNLFII